MRDKILEILKEHSGGDFCGNDECQGWLHTQEGVQAILDLLDKSLPGDVPLDSPFLSRKLWYARRGYNKAIADVRKVIKEDKMSNCCNAQVYDPSGLGIEGRCKDCLEMCLIVKEAE